MAMVAPGAANKIRTSLPVWLAVVLKAAALAAPAVPLGATTAIEIGRGWRPTSDDAAIAWRAFDVFSPHSPLLGAYNDASVSAFRPVFDLGPLQYYLLSVPDRIDPVHGLLWGSALVAGLFAALSVEAAWRAGGWLAGMAVSAAFLVITATQTVAVINLPWNPNLGLFAFAATVVLSVVAATGRASWWPVAVFTGCVAVECHLVFGAAGGAALLFSAVFGLAARKRAGTGLRPWLASSGIGVVVGLACLAPTLVQQLADHRGNLTAMLHNLSHQGPSGGFARGLQAVARSAGIWPTWAHPVPPVGSFVLDARFVSSVLLGSTVAGIAVIGLAVVVFAGACVARRPGLAALAGVAAVSAVGLAWTIGAVAASRTAVLTYSDVALWPVGMALDAAIVWGAAEVLRAGAQRFTRSPEHRSRPRTLVPVMTGAALLGLLAAGGWSLSSVIPAASHADAVIGGWDVARAVGPVAAEIERRAPKDPVVVEPSVHLLPNGLSTWALTEGVVYELHVSGVDAGVPYPMAPELGPDAFAARHAAVFVLRPLGHGRWAVRRVANEQPMVAIAWVTFG